MSNQRQAKFDEAARESAGVHRLPGEQEERNRE